MRCAGGPCRSRDPRDQTLCDQRLRSRMLRISTCLPTKIVDKPALGVARAGVPHLRRRGQSLSDQALGRGMRRLSTRLPTQSVDKPVRPRGRQPVTWRDDVRAALCLPRAAFEAARTKSFGSSA
ncbi:hypothetical protein DF043_22435 [Burkholderia cepacia]|nr:hypothetical protein DF043_22435 [Burkholderia cepacia]